MSCILPERKFEKNQKRDLEEPQSYKLQPSQFIIYSTKAAAKINSPQEKNEIRLERHSNP